MCKSRRQALAGFFLFMFPALGFSSAPNVYITSDGSSQGACTSGTHTPAWFNSPANWGGGANQIGAGTTVLLCGKFTDPTPGDTLLTFQGSGSRGNPITLSFDTGASLTNSAYWQAAGADGGAIVAENQSYITINGGTDGLIQNTRNGTGLAYAHNSSGVTFIGGSNIIVENLNIANICQHTSTSDDNGCTTSGSVDDGISISGTSSVQVLNNTVHDSATCVYILTPTGTNNLIVSGNRMYRCNWGIGIGVPASSGTASGITISQNAIHDAANWDTKADTFHHNGIMLYDVAGTAGFNGVVEANNYIYGDFGIDNTGWIFNDDNTGQMRNFLIYNNVLVNGSSVNTVNNDYLTGVPIGSQVYNNTIWGNGLGAAISSSSGTTIENNLLANVKQFIAVTSPTLVDYNQYMGAVGSGCSVWLYGGGPCTGQNSFAAWQAACSCDSHGAYNSADTINSNGTPQAGSPVIHAGSNLSSLSITALDSDHAGKARPSTGAWDIGAYELLSTPNPPTGMTGSAK